MKHQQYSNNVAIQLTNVGKKYSLHREKPTLSEKLVTSVNETFWALKDINLIIHKGDRLGILGSNGSGKTTLLKIMAGITTQTIGKVTKYGRLVSLIDLEAGFHPELTGLQNIFINSALLGANKKETQLNIKKIESFADIGKFIQSPLYTYSSGMKLRLGFSIAIHFNPDILIIDEGISVGDQNFHKKSKAKLREFIKNNKTLILTSHVMGYQKEYCNRYVWLKNGHLHMEGKREVISSYENLNK